MYLKSILLLPLMMICVTPLTLFSQQNHADCFSAMSICNKAPLYLDGFYPNGTQDESNKATCFSETFKELNSYWLSWEVIKSGNLEFTILPYSDQEDIDFILFDLGPSGDCQFMSPIRCMAAGPDLGLAFRPEINCTGATGLRQESSLLNNGPGCSNLDNFLSPVYLDSSHVYALWIHSMYNTSPAVIEWGGDCEFRNKPGSFCDGLLSSTHEAENHFLVSGLQPNPATHFINIDIQSTEKETLIIEIIDQNGSVKLTNTLSTGEGITEINLPVKELIPGTYFIRILNEKTVKVKRFIKI